MEARKPLTKKPAREIKVGIFGQKPELLKRLINEIDGGDFAEFLFYDYDSSFVEKEKACLQPVIIFIVNQQNSFGLIDAKAQLHILTAERKKKSLEHPRFILVGVSNEEGGHKQIISDLECEDFLFQLTSQDYIKYTLRSVENTEDAENAARNAKSIISLTEAMLGVKPAEEKLALHEILQAEILPEAKGILKNYLKGTLWGWRQRPYTVEVKAIIDDFASFTAIADVVLRLQDIKAKPGKQLDAELSKCIDQIDALSDSLRLNTNTAKKMIA